MAPATSPGGLIGAAMGKAGGTRPFILKTLGPAEALRAALAPLAPRMLAAWLYGSVAKGSDSARDIDVLIVADELTLEEVYAALGPAEKRLGRPVSPTLHTQKEFKRRRTAGNAFLAKVLAGEHILLMGTEDAVSTAR